MPRNSASKYVGAHSLITTTADTMGIDPIEISNILLVAINANRIRMKGKLIPRYEHSFAGLLETLSELKTVKEAFFPRGWMKRRLKVQTVMEGVVIKRPFLCGSDSQIKLRPLSKREYTMSLYDAKLLRSDAQRVLHQAFAISSPAASLGVKRSDRVWGDVVLHLIDLDRRNALKTLRTPERLISAVLKAVPDTNPTSIASVLTYVSRSMATSQPR